MARESAHVRTLIIEVVDRFGMHRIPRRKDRYLKLHGTGLSPSQATEILVQQTDWTKASELAHRVEPLAHAILVLLNSRECIDGIQAWRWVLHFFTVGGSYGLPLPPYQIAKEELRQAVSVVATANHVDSEIADMVRRLFGSSLDGYEMSRGVAPHSLRRAIMGAFAEDSAAGELAVTVQRTVDALTQVLARDVTLPKSALQCNHAPQAWETAAWFLKVATYEHLDKLAHSQRHT